MPRDGAGIYSLPNGSIATPNTTILASQHNTPLNDIATEMTGSMPRSGVAPMLGDLTLFRDPVTALHAATKQYVDNTAAGLDIKPSVKCATTANIALTAEQTLDGVLTSNSRVLVKNQTTPAQNGIYVTAAGAWTRASDMDAWSEVPGSSVWVEQGTTLGDTAWVCTADQGGTIGTTAITWAQFGGTGAFQAASVLLSSLAALAIVAGDIIYGSGANALARLAKGANGTFLGLVAGLPSWVVGGLISAADQTKLNGIPFTKEFVSADQVITAAGTLTLAHGMGVVPKFYAANLVCQVAEGGYSIGDVINVLVSYDNTASSGFQIFNSDATNVNGIYASTAGSAWAPINKTTGVRFNITNANWKMRLKAWG
jgi:hypothetical protein